PLLLFVPVALARSARPIAVIAARHHITNPRLLIAVVVVVGNENVAKAIYAGLVFVPEIMGNQLQVFSIQVAAPDRAALAIGVVRFPLSPLAVAALQAIHALVADAEIQLAVRTDQDAVDAVIVVDASETAEELFGRSIGLAIAILILEKQNVRRLTDINLV